MLNTNNYIMYSEKIPLLKGMTKEKLPVNSQSLLDKGGSLRIMYELISDPYV